MKIHARGLELTPTLREHVERRLAFALGRFEPRIRSVTVNLDDTNGPRGGVDKRCRVRVRLTNTTVVVEDLAAEIAVAVDRAGDRIDRAVARALDRRRAFTDRTSAAGTE